MNDNAHRLEPLDTDDVVAGPPFFSRSRPSNRWMAARRSCSSVK